MKRISSWWLTILVFLVLPALALVSWELLQRHRMAPMTEDAHAAVAEFQAGSINVGCTENYATARSRSWKLEQRKPDPNGRSWGTIHLFLVQRWFETPTLSVIWMMDLPPSIRAQITSVLQAHGLKYRVHELIKGR
jgi:hypothetical protein